MAVFRSRDARIFFEDDGFLNNEAISIQIQLNNTAVRSDGMASAVAANTITKTDATFNVSTYRTNETIELLDKLSDEGEITTAIFPIGYNRVGDPLWAFKGLASNSEQRYPNSDLQYLDFGLLNSGPDFFVGKVHNTSTTDLVDGVPETYTGEVDGGSRVLSYQHSGVPLNDLQQALFIVKIDAIRFNQGSAVGQPVLPPPDWEFTFRYVTGITSTMFRDVGEAFTITNESKFPIYKAFIGPIGHIAELHINNNTTLPAGLGIEIDYTFLLGLAD